MIKKTILNNKIKAIFLVILLLIVCTMTFNNIVSAKDSYNQNKEVSIKSNNDNFNKELPSDKEYKNPNRIVEDTKKTNKQQTKRHIFSWWTDGKYNIFEFIIAGGIIFTMSLISTYLKRK